jgi:hypothetical protein
MHFSEEELREALRRKDPGESFTRQVMARVALQQAQGAARAKLSDRFRELWRGRKLRPMWAGALVAVLIFGGSLGLVQYRRVQEQRAGEAAKQEAFLALRITNAKLNHVFERVKTPQAP